MVPYVFTLANSTALYSRTLTKIALHQLSFEDLTCTQLQICEALVAKSYPSIWAPPSDRSLFHHYMFHCSTIWCSTVPPSDVLLFHHQMFHCSTIRCSTVPPSDVPLFHHQMFPCSTIRCSTFKPSDVPLFYHLCSTVPPSYNLLPHHQIFYCSIIFVPLFHH